MCAFVKTSCFYSFTINSQSKLKKFSRLFFKHLPRKTLNKLNKVSWWALWVGDPRNFHSSFFIKNYYLNLNFFFFFKYCRALLSLKTKRNLLKKDVSRLKIAWNIKRQNKNIKERERKTKNEKKPNNKKSYIFSFTFLYGKIYILFENIFGKTSFIPLHLYYSFSPGRSLQV